MGVFNGLFGGITNEGVDNRGYEDLLNKKDEQILNLQNEINSLKSIIKKNDEERKELALQSNNDKLNELFAPLVSYLTPLVAQCIQPILEQTISQYIPKQQPLEITSGKKEDNKKETISSKNLKTKNALDSYNINPKNYYGRNINDVNDKVKKDNLLTEKEVKNTLGIDNNISIFARLVEIGYMFEICGRKYPTASGNKLGIDVVKKVYGKYGSESYQTVFNKDGVELIKRIFNK